MSNQLSTEEIEQLISVLDIALQSNTPAVVSALQNLILVTSLAADTKNKVGPLQQLVDSVKSLQRNFEKLVLEVEALHYNRPTSVSSSDYRYGKKTDYMWYDELLKQPRKKR